MSLQHHVFVHSLLYKTLLNEKMQDIWTINSVLQLADCLGLLPKNSHSGIFSQEQDIFLQPRKFKSRSQSSQRHYCVLAFSYQFFSWGLFFFTLPRMTVRKALCFATVLLRLFLNARSSRSVSRSPRDFATW